MWNPSTMLTFHLWPQKHSCHTVTGICYTIYTAAKNTFTEELGTFLHQLYFNLHNYFYFSMAWWRIGRRDTKQACYIHSGVIDCFDVILNKMVLVRILNGQSLFILHTRNVLIFKHRCSIIELFRNIFGQLINILKGNSIEDCSR